MVDNNFLQIFLYAIVQSQYDFSGWYGWIKESVNTALWKIILFRIAKFILDFPVTMWLFHSYNILLSIAIAFYIFKWFGGCDALYILTWMAIEKRVYPTKADWLWWTPFGLILSIMKSIKEKKLTKAEITLKAFWIQVGIGVLISYGVYLWVR